MNIKTLTLTLLAGTITASTAAPKINTPIKVTPAIHHYSSGLVDAIKSFENLPLSKKSDDFVVYVKRNKSDGNMEIGYGFTDDLVDAAIRFRVLPKGSKLPRKMTKAQADKYLVEVVLPTFRKVVSHYTDVSSLSLKQRDALIMFAYNLGEGTLKRLKVNDKTLGITDTKILKYSYCKGKKLKGLTRRRQFEINLFNS